MKKILLTLALVISTSPLLANTHKDLTDSETIATRFVEQLVQGEFNQAHETFDQAMAMTMPKSTLRRSWIKLQHKTGDFKVQIDTDVESNPHYDVVDVRCEFERLDVDVRVIVDGEKIAGLYFVRAS